MRKNFGAKSAVYPMPVFIVAAYDKDGNPNAMNAAWGGISEENEISICLSDDHKTTKNIEITGAFTVSMATADFVSECDYLGVVSGNDIPDKLSVCGLHTERAEHVNAPIITELPMTLECTLKNYDADSCRLVGEIVNISVDETVIKDGVVDLSLLRPLTYDAFGHGYYAIGERVGNAFSDGLKFKK